VPLSNLTPRLNELADINLHSGPNEPSTLLGSGGGCRVKSVRLEFMELSDRRTSDAGIARPRRYHNNFGFCTD
jgi:hypothetical protein